MNKYIEEKLYELQEKENVQKIINKAKVENIEHEYKKEIKYKKVIKLFFTITIAILFVGVMTGIKNIALGILITTVSSITLAIFGGIYAFLGEYD